MRHFIVFLILLLSAGLMRADDLLAYCLEPYQPLLTIAVYPPENGVIFAAYMGAGGELIQVYHTLATGAVELFVDGTLRNCVMPQSEGDLPSITLYPLGGQRWTWAVQDAYGHWHPVQDKGVLVVTPLEYDDQGRAITRLVVNRHEPIDPARYHIFDENGNIAG